MHPTERKIAEGSAIQYAAGVSALLARGAVTPAEVVAWDREVRSLEREVTPEHRWALTACGPGCAHCCRVRVEAFPVEVALLHRAAHGLPGHADRVRAYVAALRQVGRARRADFRTDCPLLGPERRCAAYEDRPSACRGENSMSEAECAEPGGSHHYEVSLRMLPRTAVGAAQVVFGRRGLDVFPVDLGLALGEVAHLPAEEPLRRWAAGEVLFEGSRVQVGARHRDMLVQLGRGAKSSALTP